MEEAFRAILTGDASVTALAAGGINFGTHPQGQPLPAIVLNLVSVVRTYSVAAPDQTYDARVQVDCYAQTYGAMKGLSRAVVAALNGHRGDGFKGIFHVAERDSREGGADEASRPYRATLDFMAVYG